jgi:putative ABC transport system permease protein
MRTWLRRLAGLVGRGGADRDLDAEIASHLQLHIDDNVRAGMAPDDARRAALVKFGGVEAAKEAYRDQHGVPVVETILQDVRYGLRLLRRSPGVAAIAIGSLAVGVGVTSAVFSWTDDVLLNPLPGVPAAGRVVAVETVTAADTYIDSSWLDYRDIRERSRAFDGLLAFNDRPLRLGPDTASTRVWALCVSGNYFDVLQVKPEAGRFFDPAWAEERPGARPVAVISDGLWARQFQRSPAAIGATIRLNRHPFTVIGVAPRAFHGTITGLTYEVYVPVVMEQTLAGSGDWLASRSSRPLKILGRLRPGVTVAQAQDDVAGIGRALAAEYAESNRDVGAAAVPFAKAPYGAQNDLGTLLIVLLALGGLVLLIVSANVSGLLLAQGVARRRELAVRLAVGATPVRIVRQLLVEAVLVALLGGAAGVLVAAWASRGLAALLPASELPIALLGGISPAVLVFTLGLSLAVAVLFGTAPSLHARRVRVVESLTAERAAMPGPQSRWLRSGLVVGELTLAVVALVSAGLLLRTFANARAINPGFDERGVLLAGFDLGSAGDDRAAGLAFQDRLRAALEALPGVQAVSYAEDVPLGFSLGSWETLSIDGYVPRPGESMKIYRNLVAPGYFSLMKIPLVEGRDFSRNDNDPSAPVAVVNRTFARRYFGHADPIGRHFTSWGRTVTIVGVAADIKVANLAEPAAPYFWVPMREFYQPSTGFAVHVRTAGDPLRLLPDVRRAVGQTDPAVTVDVATTLADYTGAALFTRRAAAVLGSVLGAIALLLAAIGLYGVLAYAVAQRTREIGLRVALGAPRSRVLGLVLGHASMLLGTGLLLGLAAAAAAGRLFQSLLIGVGPADLSTRAFVAGVLGVTALLAAYVPARRALSVDPLTALRHE